MALASTPRMGEVMGDSMMVCEVRLEKKTERDGRREGEGVGKEGEGWELEVEYTEWPGDGG